MIHIQNKVLQLRILIKLKIYQGLSILNQKSAGQDQVGKKHQKVELPKSNFQWWTDQRYSSSNNKMKMRFCTTWD